MNLFTHIKELLSKNEKFCKDNELFKNNIVEAALKLDTDLIKLLLTDNKAKETFFIDIEGVMVFDKVKFQKFVSNKQFLPDSYTAFKNKIGLTANGEFLTDAKEVVLDFPYKDCVLEGGQTKEDQKRKEIFWNETLAPDDIDRLFEPKVFTNWKKYDKDGEHEVTDISLEDNLIIKGNNLIALHSLKEVYRGKIKLIYIDPPYNTGGDANIFTYNNTFNHSTWLTFMKNRLEVAKELLTDDGFISIAIDHYELGYLIVLADEIFGRNNRIGIVSVIHKPEGRSQEKFFGTSNEFMLVYSKNKHISSFNKIILNEEKKIAFNLKDKIGSYKLRSFIRGEAKRNERPNQFYPIFVSQDLNIISLSEKEGYYKIYPKINDIEKAWFLIPKSAQAKIENNELVATKNNKNQIQINYKVRETEVITTHWIHKKYNAIASGTRLLEKIIGRKGVSYPKSMYLVKDVLKLMTNKNDIILDFHSGSGTTGHATIALNQEDGGNRKFILVEQLDEHIDICIERNQKVLEQGNINSSFKYLELSKWNANAKNEILECKNIKELQNTFEDIYEKYQIKYNVNVKQFKENVLNDTKFLELQFDEQQQMFLDIIDSNQMYVNYSDMEDKNHTITDTDKDITTKFYNL
ncbi:MAG: site-specific DNA-methyltransferase [Flavobacteriales bacterium]|nr:site-specific DNA-methyltransferase [Flavobacteriales bacterium]